MRASRILGLTLLAAAVSLLGTSPGHANCSTPIAVFQGYTPSGYFSGCGDAQAYFFYWQHHFGVQKTYGANTTLTGLAGNDSGAQGDALGEGVFVPYDNYVDPIVPGNYVLNLSSYDWGNYGPDGCPMNKMETDTSCSTLLPNTIPVNNLTFAGYDADNRLVAKALVVSVDGNEPNQFWILDQAGAPDLGGNGCQGNENSFAVDPPVCGTIPVPAITSAGCDTTGCTLNVAVGPHGVPIITDCEVAASKLINCTGPVGDKRSLYVGRQLFVKRAACDATNVGNIGTFDTRSFVMNFSAGTIARGFVPYAPQDLNLNGIKDGIEATHVPLIIAGNDLTTVPVFIPKIVGAIDCAYLAVGLLLDQNPDLTGCGGPCDKVVTPLVSVNRIPIWLDGDSVTPSADRVFNLAAGKTAGKANVSWETTAEFTTAGFNLIGVKKSGGDVQLNSALIPAQKGTTGESASYSINLGPRDLKGSTAVYVELVKISGAKERFGPASF